MDTYISETYSVNNLAMNLTCAGSAGSFLAVVVFAKLIDLHYCVMHFSF